MPCSRIVFVLLFTTIASTAASQNLLPRDRPNPLEAVQSLWTEELTWMEVRDALAAGKTTIIIGTGGIEQNGPYVATGKHNYVLATVLPHIAREIGNALIAPIVKFVPEGEIEPTPGGHMLYPGTISLDETTFIALLRDICRSYKAHGFVDIVLLGDSGGNQEGMKKVAEALNQSWAQEAARVHYLEEFYSVDIWSYEYLKQRGIMQIDETPMDGASRDQPTAFRNGLHDDIYYEAQVAVQNPVLIRTEQRRKADLFHLHGVDLEPVEDLIALGRDLAQYRAEITAKAFQASVQRLRPE